MSRDPRTAFRATLSGLTLATALAVTPALAQDSRPLALTHARVLTMTEQGTILDATILIRDGRIEAVGKDVKVPAGAHVVDLRGASVMPGLVQTWSRVGIDSTPPPRPPQPQPQGEQPRQERRGRPSGGGGKISNRAAAKAAEGLYARQEVFRERLEQGVTTLVIRPAGAGFAGLAARLDPSATSAEALVIDDAQFLLVEPQTNAAAKKSIAETFDQAQKLLEQRRNPPPPPEPKNKPEPAPAEAEPKAAKPGPETENKPAEEENKEEPPKPEGDEPKGEQPEPAKPEKAKQAPPKKKVDPNLDALADVLDDQRPAFVELSSAAELLHWLDGVEERRFPRTVVVVQQHNPRAGRIEQALDSLLEFQPSAVLMPPDTPTVLNTSAISNPALALHRAGIPVGFLLPEGERSLIDLRYKLMELVRAGLPAEQALRGVCAVPALALGIDDELGSIAEGRRADLLVFDRDPLDPSASLQTIYLSGQKIDKPEDAQR